MSRLPGVSDTAPGQTHDKEQQTSSEEAAANKVKFLQLLPLAAVAELVVELGREVEENVQAPADRVHDEHEPVAPSPLLLSIQDKGLADGGCEARDGQCPDIEPAVGQKAVLHGHQLVEDEEGGELRC